MNFIPETPSVARMYCPGCEPTADPCAEVLDVRWCATHGPVPRGAEDDAVVVQSWMSGSTEAGGEDNRRFCELFHRGARRLPPAVEDALDRHAERMLGGGV